MRLKLEIQPQADSECKDVLPIMILAFGMYTVGDTLVGKKTPILNLGRLGGWLEAARLGEAPLRLEKWNPGPSEAEAGSRETATRCGF
jgi:hypothetical protein